MFGFLHILLERYFKNISWSKTDKNKVFGSRGTIEVPLEGWER